MSLPRQVTPGRCYMLTRRCSERRFFMRPDPDTSNAFLYCLAVAAEKTGVGVVFFLAMSNHYHAGVVDTHGRLPEFLEHFHKLFAKHQNALRGRWENFWATEQTSAVELVGAEDVLDKMVYVLSNPVKDHLVQSCHQWPGASSLGAQLHGHRLSATRPSHLFRPEGPMPPEITLKLTHAPGWDTMSTRELAVLLTEHLERVEERASHERARTGTKVLGRRGVLQQRWWDRPQTHESRRRMSPRLASKNTWRRIETLRRNRAFVNGYRSARELFRAGIAVLFPEGTYWLRRFAGAACAAPS